MKFCGTCGIVYVNSVKKCVVCKSENFGKPDIDVLGELFS